MLCKKDDGRRDAAGRPSRNVGYWMAIGYEAGIERCMAKDYCKLTPEGACWQTLAEKQNAVLRCSPGCKPGAGCLRGAKPRIYICRRVLARCVLLPADFCQQKKSQKIYPFFKNSAYCM